MKTSEDQVTTKYTEKRYLCPTCMRTGEFELIAVHEGSQYYLMERCPRCQKHVEDIKEVPYRLAEPYIQK